MSTTRNFNDKDQYSALKWSGTVVNKEGKELPCRLVMEGLKHKLVETPEGVQVKLLGKSVRVVPVDPTLRQKLGGTGSRLIPPSMIKAGSIKRDDVTDQSVDELLADLF